MVADMKKILVFAGVAFVGAVLLGAQFDRDRVIAGGGVFVQGWTGKIDAGSTRQGRVLNDAKFVQEGNALHVTTGPATTFWNPANTASGDYTVKATFLEPKFMELNSHAHSYGIVIGGTNLGTDQMSYVVLRRVRGRERRWSADSRGPTVFTLLRTSPNAAVHKAAGVGQPVTQEIAWRVKGWQGRVLDQRHRGRRLRQGAAGRPREAAINRWRVRHPLYPQR